MKFVLQSASNFGRLGIISSIPRLKEFEMETPHVLLHTINGTVPHLTHEVLQMVTKENLGLNIPVQNVCQVQEQIKLYNNSIAHYIGMNEYLSYCSFINPFDNECDHSHLKDKVGFQTRHGKRLFSAAEYMEFIQDSKPDMFLLLADGWTNMQSSKKRIHKSFENSAKLFEKCMEIYKESASLKSCQPLGALEGGSNIILREKFSELIGGSPVFGVVVDGLLNSIDAVLDTKLPEIQTLVEASLKHIPKDKLRIIHGCWNPSMVLGLIELGIDVFDSSYPIEITERKGALMFPNTEDILEKYKNTSIVNSHEENVDIKNQNEKILSDSKTEEPSPKKIKLANNSKYFISMSDPCHSTDFTPINRHCTCLACKNHTRAYIHHLVTVKEMLGEILLMIHNLHHYLLFFSTIRSTLKTDKFHDFKKSFQIWLDDIKDSPPPS